MFLRYEDRDGEKVLQQWRTINYMNRDYYYSILVEGWVDVPTLSGPEPAIDEVWMGNEEYAIKFADDADYQAFLATMGVNP